MYPSLTDQATGKLRLLYECNPMAFIIERAGGVATDGSQRILDIVPTTLHQRSPFYGGSRDMMEELSDFLNRE
jgi:fructose-1,6-bisphosphatase I